ncbi:MAG: glycoside hydrolase family 15 protein [Sedimentisphaerales bacterium]|nr:glycoside hydrolase family 15 protein [Sedimentisphaerales bacterium]
MKRNKIKELIQVSKEVIEDGSLENGAIVAANSDKSIYPATTQDYRYVWIRDAAYVCMAADLLGLREIPERFFNWCFNRAEDFKETGLFYNAYNVNGTIHGTLISPNEPRVPRHLRETCIDLIHCGTQFQPDQSGSLLFAIDHHVKHFNTDVSKFKKLIEKAASGICRVWKGDAFILPCYDLWEERCVLPKQRGFHTYSLAMCIAGLRAAIEMQGKKKKWMRTKKEMSDTFAKVYSGSTKSIHRTYRKGKLARNRITGKNDMLPDTSLLGLVWPSGILNPNDEVMKRTVREVIKSNTTNGGDLFRYPADRYCGGVRKGWVTLTGAGTWPLLSFWMSIYYNLSGDKENARKFFDRTLERIDKYIPEQIFEDKSRSSISPLLWSHAMFVIAAKYLGHI